MVCVFVAYQSGYRTICRLWFADSSSYTLSFIVTLTGNLSGCFCRVGDFIKLSVSSLGSSCATNPQLVKNSESISCSTPHSDRRTSNAWSLHALLGVGGSSCHISGLRPTNSQRGPGDEGSPVLDPSFNLANTSAPGVLDDTPELEDADGKLLDGVAGGPRCLRLAASAGPLSSGVDSSEFLLFPVVFSSVIPTSPVAALRSIRTLVSRLLSWPSVSSIPATNS